MSEHSPGPWKWESLGPNRDRLTLLDRDGRAVINSAPWGGGTGSTVIVAYDVDDRLIAAAPELLACLKLGTHHEREGDGCFHCTAPGLIARIEGK